jgi:hypothetical protein
MASSLGALNCVLQQELVVIKPFLIAGSLGHPTAERHKKQTEYEQHDEP